MINNYVPKLQTRAAINEGIIQIEGKLYENITQFGSQGTQTFNRIGNLLGNRKEEIIIKEYYTIKQEEIEVLQKIRRLQSEKQSKCQNIIKILGIQDNSINYQQKQGPKVYVALEKGKDDVLILMQQNKHLPYIIKLNLFLQMVQGVKELHDLGYFHRDVKPENFVYFLNQNQEYQIKLIDFGFAKRTDTINQTPQIGTYIYMAPEVFQSEANYDKTADIWSLGITFYYILTLQDFIEANNILALRKYFVELTQKQIDKNLDNSNDIEQYEKDLLSCMLQQNKSFRIGLQELITKINFRIKSFQQEKNSEKKDQKIQPQSQKFQQFDKFNFCQAQDNKKNQLQFQKFKQQGDDEVEKLPKFQMVMKKQFMEQDNQQDNQQGREVFLLTTQFLQFQKVIKSIKIECESNEFLNKMKEKTFLLLQTLKEQNTTFQEHLEAFCENEKLFKERFIAIEKRKGIFKDQIKDLLVQQQKVSQKAGGELELLISSVQEKYKKINFIPINYNLMEFYESLQKQEIELSEEILQINSTMSHQLHPSQLNQLKEQIQKAISKLDELKKQLPQDNEIQEFNKIFKSNLESYYTLYALVNYIKQFHITKYYERIKEYANRQKKKQMNQSEYVKQFNKTKEQELEDNIKKEKEAQDLLYRYKNILFKNQISMMIEEMEKDQQQMDKIIEALEININKAVSVKLKGAIKNKDIIKQLDKRKVYKIRQFASNLIFNIIFPEKKSFQQ